jgi:hypothetical protein
VEIVKQSHDNEGFRRLLRRWVAVVLRAAA